MPELPEVTTTANKLDQILPSLKIKSVWTSYDSPYYKGKENIKDPAYFNKFKKGVVGEKFIKSYRIGKNVLLKITNSKLKTNTPLTILIHLKMKQDLSK